MKIRSTLTLVAAIAALAGTPVLADPGGGRGNGNHGNHQNGGRDCPPGLAKKNPPCVPPGQARHGKGVGDILRNGDYIVIRDPRRYNLEPRDDWRYYRDGDRVYRVDPTTRKILAVVNLIDAFTN
ncbi:hypothetical protein [Falsirhodobacter deserti]|uniref:hypothetical protein n=1 Tax=Falsirhodobacter deserti TaxID=1365611 RepID=UPI000FE3A77F|nr:hypothetical protein [Falsirhodobacter deserti]